MVARAKELIIVRSLAESDLGLFAAHRSSASSKQRAININAPIARRLVSPTIFKDGGADFDCTCRFRDIEISEPRRVYKSQKNWRLGGAKIMGDEFALLDSRDFVLIRSPEMNDGSLPISLTFISRNHDRVVHAGVAAIVERHLDRSMAVFEKGAASFDDLGAYCPSECSSVTTSVSVPTIAAQPPIPAMPRVARTQGKARARTIEEKINAPHILERMLQVAGDLSAPAQLRFMETVQQLATTLREVLLHTGGIITIPRNHPELWEAVKGKSVGFVDGGLANLSMLGSAPIAARVGGYVVTPGDRSSDREQFTVLKYLIDELYVQEATGVYNDSFPDVSALRDAARISIEAAGAVGLLQKRPDLSWVMLHGALVNPVSRYTDVMQEGRVRHHFPEFSQKALKDLLPEAEPARSGRDAVFVSVYLRQLQLLQECGPVVCGVIERESTTSSVIKAVLNSLNDQEIRDLLPVPPAEWKTWFRNAVDPSDDDELEGQRITDSLLFRCVLEPGEALAPVPVDRNDQRRAPKNWADIIFKYPTPQVSYLQATEWNSPVRVEMFEEQIHRFKDTAALILHCALLLPKYAFPVGLDIVDKFAKIPNWMSRPVNTHTAVGALKRALDDGDEQVFDSLRRMLCGSGREWLLRPGIFK